MGGGGGHGGGQFGSVMRSMRRDDSVIKQEISKGTARRMMRFARPYRRILIWFLVLVVVDAVIGVINPLLFRSRPRWARGSSSTCGRRSSATSSRCPWPSSPAPRPVPSSAA